MKTTATKHRTSSKAEPGVVMKMDPSPGAEDRVEYIATAAYFKAEARGFMPGKELDDWLEAESKFEAGKGH